MSSDNKKLSFAEIQGQINAAQNNSDLQNLAHALAAVGHHRRALDKLEKEITDMAAAVEAGDFPGVDALRDLYDRAHGRDQKRVRL